MPDTTAPQPTEPVGVAAWDASVPDGYVEAATTWVDGVIDVPSPEAPVNHEAPAPTAPAPATLTVPAGP